jgi:hypothetical protein
MLNSRESRALLGRLCAELGFCLPPDSALTIEKSPPSDVSSFATAVFEAEGLDAQQADRRLFRQVRDIVQEAFHASARRIEIDRIIDGRKDADSPRGFGSS